MSTSYGVGMNRNNDGSGMVYVTSDDQVLEAGTRIYYSGDRANHEREGTILRVFSDKWGNHVEVNLDAIECNFSDGEPERKTTLSTLSFEPGPGRRFQTLESYSADRQAKLEAFYAQTQARMEARRARRA